VISKSLSSTKQSAQLEARGRETKTCQSLHIAVSPDPIMVHIHCAYTEQINPKGVEPVLSRDQASRFLACCYLEIVVRGEGDLDIAFL